jgi:trimeric autotransporter adhesin
MSQKNCCHPELLISAAKRIALAFGLIAFLLAVGLPAGAQMQMVPGVTTVAGNGTTGFAGDSGPATSAELNSTQGVATDSAGNLYIADWQNNRVREVNAATGVITTIAGTGTAGYSGDGGAATSAMLKGPTGVLVDSAGNVYIADQANNRVRKVDAGTGVITTIAGTGTTGFSGDGGVATNAAMFSPTDLIFNSAGDLYISDDGNHRIRKVAAGTGVITTVAGNGTPGYSGDGGAATSAELYYPAGMVVDSADNLYIADTFNNRVRKVNTTTGIITTYAGTGTAGFSGDGGAAASAQFSTPARLTLDKAGNMFVADQSNNRVREIFQGTGIITTVAGNGTAGFSGDGGPGTAAAFHTPLGIAIDNVGSLYISDSANNRIRKLAITANNFPTTTIGASSVVQNILLQTTAAETITSITVPQSQGGKQEYSIGTITGCVIGGSNAAGTVCTIPVTFTPAYPGRRWIPLQVVTSTGNINFGLTGIGTGPLAALTPGIITTFAGNGTGGYSGDGGAATSAQVNSPVGVAFDSAGNLYIGDYSNSRVRKVNAATGTITTVAGNGTAGYSGDGGPATSAQLNGPEVVALDSAGNLYIAEYGNHRIRKVAAATGIITTVAGNGTQNYSGDGGPATSAALWTPTGVALDSAGNLYIADFGNHRIRKVAAATGIITTVAGNGTQGYSGDGGPATSAELGDPTHVVLDSVGNLIIADGGNNRVRKVTVATGIITTVAGNGTGAYSGDGGPATSAALHNPEYLTFDSADNLYIGDYLNNRVRKVTVATGIITTVAGNGTGAYAGDGGAATSAALQYPSSIAFDNAGNLYVSDLGNSRIRKLDLSQSVLTHPTATKVGTSDATDNPQTAILSNIGNASLTVPPPSAGSNPSVSLNFALDAATTCPQLSTSSSSQALAAGAQCTYAIDFAPTVAGAITGSAVVTDNSLNIAGSTQTIHLNATGVAVSTTTTLTSSVNPSVFGQVVIFTATVAPTVGTALPTGTVQFSVDGTAVGGPVTLNGSGAATLTSGALTVGTHSITAVYTPDSTSFTGSSATALSQVVSKATLGQNGVANIALNSSPNPSNVGQSVTFTATVPAGVTGSVTFKEGTTTLGTGTISGTTATFTTTTLAVGTHPVTAVYGGDANYNTATSAVDNHVVNNGGATNTNFLPAIPVATTSAAQNITFTIPATGTITSISIPQSQGGKQEYAIQSITGCTVGASNPAGTVCTISITFTPGYPGQRWVPLQVVSSGGNFNVGLTGIGLGPLVALTPGIITTVAGNGTAGYTGDGGPATSAEINALFRQALDSAGNIYTAEYGNNRIRKVAAGTGIITTVAGNGTAGFSGDGGQATSAELNGPQGVYVDSAGNLYIADSANSRVRKVDAATGVITTVAGNGTAGYAGDGGPATSAGLVHPGDVYLDSAGNLYITDYNGCRIRKVAAGTGIITTVAGNGTPAYAGDGGPATSAELYYPSGVAIDGAGNLYIGDQYSDRVRKVSATTGIITTVAGNGTQGFSGDGGPATSAELYYPGSLAFDSADNLYISDQFNNRVRKVDAGTGVITTLVGTGPAGFAGDGGPATRAAVAGALGISLDGAGNLYIADYGNNRIRKVDRSQSQLTYPTATKVGTSDTTDDPQTVTVSNIGNASLTVPPPSSGSNPQVSVNFALDAAALLRHWPPERIATIQ